MVKLSSQLKESLINQVESGMGYQYVDIEDNIGYHKQGTVYNGNLLLYDQEATQVISESLYDSFVKTASLDSSRIKSVNVIAPSPVRKTLTEEVLGYLTKSASSTGKPAKDSEIEKTKKGDIFKRFSAFANDNRVNSDGSLKPGTYATTEADARNVKTGKDAVERYSIPNPTPAKYVFSIKPKENTDIKQGIVQPDFGHKGGGAEVIFVNGTTSNTVTGPTTIPAE